MFLDLVERITLEMNLREPQADSLLKFHNLTVNIDLAVNDQARIKRLLETGALRFPDEYARLTFALATGVGKTRLMGALMAYLFLTGKSRDFVLIAPSTTIYDKLKRESVATHPKYLFGGLSGFPIPEVYHAENAEACRFEQETWLTSPRLFIFTPSQLRPRSGSEAERRLRWEGETWGESFVTHLSKLPDLVVCLDEGHKYGGEAWAQAVSDLHPKLVLEMTATPSHPDTVLHRYELREALREGKYIKNVVAFTKQRPSASDDWEWDKHTLLTALTQHQVKDSALKAYHTNHPDTPKVKPLTLVVCRDVNHAKDVEKWLQSMECFNGQFQGKVLRIDNTQPKEEIVRLLNVEDSQDPTEIVVNVGMLKEGWDVMNVYVTAPLRAMVGETLTTQTIGRGLRLPYGKRVADENVDTLDVLAFGKETVQQVIEAAKQVGVTVRPSTGSAGVTFIEHTVSPLRKLSVRVPDIGLHVLKPPTLKGFSATPHVKPEPNAQPHMTKIELATGEVISVDFLPLDIPNVPRRMGQLLIRRFEELGGNHEEAEATRIFQEYFENIGCSDRDAIRRIQHWWIDIFDDMCRQVDELLQHTVAHYESTGGTEEDFTFEDMTYSIPDQDGIVPKDQADPRLHRRAYLIGGWDRSLYPEVKFDVEPELTVMKILDGTKNITWVRNPVSDKGFCVYTTAGRHYPDFLILHKNGIVLLEVKNANELSDNNSEAYLKGKAATEWCGKASEVSNSSWEYIALPHERVAECATLEDLKNKRFVFAG